MLRALSQSEPPDTRNGLAQQRLAVVGNDDRRLVRRGHHRQPGRLLHAGHRAQPPSAGAAQRPGRADPGTAAGRRSTRDDCDRPRRDRAATRIPAAAGADRGQLHPAGRHRRRPAHPGRRAAGRAGAVVGAFQRLRQGAVRDHADRRGGAGAACRATALAPLPWPARPRRPGSTRPDATPTPAEPPADEDRPRPGRRRAPRDCQTAASPAGPRHAPRAAASELSDAALVSRSWAMAFATLVSRITGFARIVLLAAILGAALSSAFSVANQLPNLVAALVLEATFTAIFVPVLARAEQGDADGGAAFVRRLVTLATTLLLLATALSVLAAPLLVRLMLGRNPQVNEPLTTAFAYLLLPQVTGLRPHFGVHGDPEHPQRVRAAGVGAGRQQRRRARDPGRVPGGARASFRSIPSQMGNAKLLVLGIGTTLGVFAQTAVLLIALRREHISLRPLWGIDERLKRFGAMAAAMVLYVLISQLGLVVGNQIASTAAASGPAIYNYTWLVLMLPFGMIGVTVLTVVMPRLSRNAAADDTGAVLADLSLATRLTLVTLIPIVAFMTVGGPAIGSALVRLRPLRAGRRRLPGRRDRVVGVHVDPVRAGATAAAGVLRPGAAVDTDRDHPRHHGRQDRRFAAGAPSHRGRPAGRRATSAWPTASGFWPARSSATSCCGAPCCRPAATWSACGRCGTSWSRSPRRCWPVWLPTWPIGYWGCGNSPRTAALPVRCCDFCCWAPSCCRSWPRSWSARRSPKRARRWPPSRGVIGRRRSPGGAFGRCPVTYPEHRNSPLPGGPVVPQAVQEPIRRRPPERVASVRIAKGPEVTDRPMESAAPSSASGAELPRPVADDFQPDIPAQVGRGHPWADSIRRAP